MSVMLVAACGGEQHPDARNITLTLIRHAESEANAADIASTTVPGPGLTPLGQEQADKLANKVAVGAAVCWVRSICEANTPS